MSNIVKIDDEIVGPELSGTKRSDIIETAVARSTPTFGLSGVWKPYMIASEPLSGSAGEIQNLNVWPGMYFKVRKLIVSPSNADVLIRQVLVGGSQQLMGAISAQIISALDDIRLDLVPPALNITIVVEFLKSCTVQVALSGSVLVPK